MKDALSKALMWLKAKSRDRQNLGRENLERAPTLLLAASARGQICRAGGRDIPERFVSQPSSSHHHFTHQSKYL